MSKKTKKEILESIGELPDDEQKEILDQLQKKQETKKQQPKGASPGKTSRASEAWG